MHEISGDLDQSNIDMVGYADAILMTIDDIRDDIRDEWLTIIKE